MVLFNLLFDKIQEQRQDEELGREFETDFMLFEEAEDTQNSRGARAPLRNNWSNRAEYEVVAQVQLANLDSSEN